MKKFLKGFGIFFFSFGFIVYTIMFFTEAPELRPVFIMMDVIMGVLPVPASAKKKAKTEGTQNRTHHSGSFQSEPGSGY